MSINKQRTKNPRFNVAGKINNNWQCAKCHTPLHFTTKVASRIVKCQKCSQLNVIASSEKEIKKRKSLTLTDELRIKKDSHKIISKKDLNVKLKNWSRNLTQYVTIFTINITGLFFLINNHSFLLKTHPVCFRVGTIAFLISIWAALSYSFNLKRLILYVENNGQIPWYHYKLYHYSRINFVFFSILGLLVLSVNIVALLI